MKEKELKEKFEKATQKIPDFIKIKQHDSPKRKSQQKPETKIRTGTRDIWKNIQEKTKTREKPRLSILRK